ncbi:MAG: DUF308 domain-containing protein [Clostridia bacterium]|nr:DUF308 domain-containing protein [Oscillospiraceae bacterium]MBQ1955709.1 DUF308 domain-containing protein [Clostridia bacterium]
MKKKKIGIVPQAKYINVGVAGIVFLTGLYLLIFPDQLSITARYVVAGMCALVGAAKMLGYFSNDMYRLAFQFDFAMGLFMFVIGVLMVVFRSASDNLLPLFIGLYTMIDGMQKAQIAIDAKKFGISMWPLILATAVVLTAVGITTAVNILKEFAAAHIMLGIALVADGCENAWITSYTVRVRATKKNLLDMLEDEDDE